MKKYKRWLVLLSICLSLTAVNRLSAQVLPQNFSNVNIDDLSDSQIMQILQQGKADGLSDNDIVQNAQNKGLSSAQAQKLKVRIAALRSKSENSTDAAGAQQQSPRTVNYQPDTIVNKKKVSAGLPVFGADLFKGTNSTFEPNLRLATPENYILGPDDQLDIAVYGNSVVNWKLNVSPEGNINLPSGGIINVAGKTITQATAEIRSRLIAKNFAIGSGSSLKVTLGNIRSIKVILIGSVVKPGTYTLPSLATAFNALYAAGGPGDNGSFRQIEIIRNNKVIRHLDIYNFLLTGDQKDNISLQDQDVIRVPPFQTRVELTGEIKAPAQFEVLPGETLKDVIRFSGGFTSAAYRKSVKVSQISDDQRRITDVVENNFNSYTPLAGDIFTVQRILDRYENRVTINGALFRPGEFELQNGMMLSQLISKAGGLKEDAFTGRGAITRLNPDNTTAIISFNVKDILNKINDIALQREDVVLIRSIFDLRDVYTVQITGEIRTPGIYPYADSMKVENLILLADGFKDGASRVRIEVARRVYDSDPASKTSNLAKVYTIDVDNQLKPDPSDFTLKPFDIVLIYQLPGYEKQGLVKVQGEVLYPGTYVIENKSERISEIIKKAGGLTAAANAEGSTLKRPYVALLGIDKNKVDTASISQEHTNRANLVKQSFSDSTNHGTELRNNFVGINMQEILNKPGSPTDLILRDGDELVIPQKQEVVTVNGEVHLPSSVVYTDSKGFRQYILDAGGYTDNSLKRGAYIIYPNGSVRGTHKFLFFNSHPEVKPGSEIFVPKKEIKKGISVADLVGIISAVSSIAILSILSFRH